MATFNFSEEDLLKEEKKKKKNNEVSPKVIEKANNNWNKIFSSNDEENNKVKETNIQNEQKVMSSEKPIKNNDTTETTVNNVKPKTQDSQKNEIVKVQSQKVQDNEEKSAYENLQDKIEEIKNQYDVKPEKGEELSTDLNLTKKDYITKSEEELKTEAENSLKDYKDAQMSSINSKLENSLNALDGKEESLVNSANTQKAQLESYYEDAKRKAENDALKRGLQRSSIVINNLNAFDNDKISKLMEIDTQLSTEINELNQEIANLNNEREQAIKDFDIEYALKLNDKISQLQQEIQDRNDEITEYNNKIAEIEAEYRKSVIESNNKTQEDYLDNLIKYGENQSIIDSMRNNAYAQVIDEYLNSLSKADALNELQNNSYIRDLLGNNYSYYLYKTQQRQ